MKKLVIIPTYNEVENIAAMIDKVFSLSVEFDLLILDDGSPDGTAKVVKSKMVEYKGRLFIIERKEKLGLGSAYITGFRWGLERNYDLFFEMDCDFSHDPEDLIRLCQSAENGKDVVIGSRYVKGVNVINWPMSRLLISYFASKYVRFVTRMKINDATAGFICYSRKVLETIDLDKIKMKEYGFQVEMKYSAWKLGFKIEEISIIFTERQEGASKMRGGIFGEALLGVLALPFRRIKANS